MFYKIHQRLNNKVVILSTQKINSKYLVKKMDVFINVNIIRK